MAVLTAEQIEDLRTIIRDGSTSVAIGTAGMEVSEEELQRLVDEGYVDPDAIKDITLDAFEFGRLMARLPEAENMTYRQFKRTIQQQPVELTPAEEVAYELARDRAGQYCVGLGTRYCGEVNNDVIELNQQLADYQREGIQTETAHHVAHRTTVGELKSRLGHIVEDWARDWGRIASTESHLAHQQGVMAQITKDHGSGEMMAKIPEPTACPDCRRLYLGPDGRPIVRPASWWESQGVANVGRKRGEWKAVLGGMHPWCFPAGQMVQTGSGLIAIEDISPGEWVLSAEGNWRRVYATYQHFYEGELVEMKTGDRTVRSTPQHLFQGQTGWEPADLFDEGSHIREMVLAEADDGPALSFEIGRLARVLFGFAPSGVPIAAVDLNGQLARPVYEIDKEATDHLIRLKNKSGPLKRFGETLFKIGEHSSFDGSEAVSDFTVRLDAPPAGFVSPSGELLALLGGEALHADLVCFRARALKHPGLLNALNDGPASHPELLGYRLYGEVFLEVKTDDELGVERDPVHAASISSRYVSVKSAGRVSPWAGWVYNLGVEEDESYVVNGLPAHNCQCQLVRVPRGYVFDADWDLVPEEMAETEKSEAPDNDLEKARKLHYRTTFAGLPISIENRKGSKRYWYDRGTDTHGETKMEFPYGYIRLTEGSDGDHLDVFLGPDEDAKFVYVVHQRKAPEFKEFDEDKLMLGFPTRAEAKAAYLRHFDSPKFFGGMTAVPMERFRQRCLDGGYRDGKMVKGEFVGNAQAIHPKDRPIGSMGMHSKPARSPGDDPYVAQMQEEHPGNIKQRKKRKKKKRRKHSREKRERMKEVGESLREVKGQARGADTYNEGHVERPNRDPDGNMDWLADEAQRRSERRGKLTIHPGYLR